MAINYIEFEEHIIENFKQSKLIERFSQTEFPQTPCLDIIIKSFEEPSKIDFDDQGLFFLDDQNEKVYIPEMYISMKDMER